MQAGSKRLKKNHVYWIMVATTNSWVKRLCYATGNCWSNFWHSKVLASFLKNKAFLNFPDSNIVGASVSSYGECSYRHISSKFSVFDYISNVLFFSPLRPLDSSPWLHLSLMLVFTSWKCKEGCDQMSLIPTVAAKIYWSTVMTYLFLFRYF